MNENDLKSLRVQPRGEFKESLQKNLWAIETEAKPKVHPTPAMRWAGYGIAVLLALSLAFFTVPSVRASVLNWVGQIAGVGFVSSNIYPDSKDAQIIQPDAMSFDQAKAALGLTLEEPQLPEGYSFGETVEVYSGSKAAQFMEQIVMKIDGPTSNFYRLNIYPESTQLSFLVGEGSTSEMTLADGSRAALTKGGWLVNTQQWEADMPQYQLSWEKDGLVFALNGLDREALLTLANAITQ